MYENTVLEIYANGKERVKRLIIYSFKRTIVLLSTKFILLFFFKGFLQLGFFSVLFIVQVQPR